MSFVFLLECAGMHGVKSKPDAIEKVEDRYKAQGRRKSRLFETRSLAEAWLKVDRAPKFKHVRIQFNNEDRRPFIVAHTHVAEDGSKKTKRRKFSSYSEAKLEATELEIATENHGRQFQSDLARDEVAAVTAWRQRAEELQAQGLRIPTLADVIRKSIDDLAKNRGSRVLDRETLEDFLMRKEDAGVKPRQLRDYDLKITRFYESFSDRMAATITPEEISDWLRLLKTRTKAGASNGGRVTPQTRKNYRAALNAFFTWLIPDANPLRKVQAPKIATPERGHYSAIETQEILAYLLEHDPVMIPPVAIGFFCGLRTSELFALDLSTIDLSNREEETEFILQARVTKTDKARSVPLVPAVKAWLLAQMRRSGPAIPMSNRPFHRRFNAACDAVKIDRVANGMRHSFATYRGAMVRNSAQVADEMGNSAAVVNRHYRDAKLRAEAEAFFAIRPDGEAKEVEFTPSAKEQTA